jgi:uncharacterized membrane protein YedE/YeeE
MAAFLAIYGPIIATVALVMAFARTGPEEARSRLSEWADLFGLKKAAAWLRAHTLDRQVLQYLTWVMGALIFIGGAAFGLWLQPLAGCRTWIGFPRPINSASDWVVNRT